VKADKVRSFGGFFSTGRCTFGEDAMLFLKLLLNTGVYFHIAPLVRIHREASGLSDSQRHIRQIEPFLLHPTAIVSACPEGLRPVLEQFLAIRACKAAAMLGYWGRWREARSLFGRFGCLTHWDIPFFTCGLIGCTPIAAVLGKIDRWSKEAVRQH
jgi:hypothetical protein